MRTRSSQEVLTFSGNGKENTNNPFWRKLAIVLLWSSAASILAGISYGVGGLDWYVELKQALLARKLFSLPVAIADVITGALIWGVSDVVGQYLAKHPPRIDRRQTTLVASFGLFGGLGTHVLLNIPDALLPVLTHTLANQLLRTVVVLIGGLSLTLLFTKAQSKAREIFRIETYRVQNERWKAADVVFVKLVAAPIKTFIVINLLPIPIRVLTEQLWDYCFTMMAAYFMNRDKPLMIEPMYTALHKFR